MRIAIRVFVVSALLAPVGVFATQHLASALTTDLTCTAVSGTTTIAPPFLKEVPGPEGPNPTDLNENKPVISSSGTFSGCTGSGGVTGGSFTSSATFTDPTGCNDLLSANGEPAPGEVEEAGNTPVGTIDVTWSPGGATSHGTVTLMPVPGHPTQTKSKSKVLTGLFHGDKSKVILSFLPNGNGDCVNTNLSGVSFSQAGSLKFTH